MELVHTRVNASVTQTTVGRSVWRASMRIGKAILVMLASMVAMNIPMAVGASVFHL